MLEFVIVLAIVYIIAPAMIGLFVISGAIVVSICVLFGMDVYTACAGFLFAWIIVNFLGVIRCI